MIEAIRYGERDDVKAHLTTVMDTALDQDHLRNLLADHALARDTMDVGRVRQIREDMERADARRLQPHYIGSFFAEAFRLLGGAMRERESRRFEITHVPAPIRNRDRQIGTGRPVQPRYQRVTFEKKLKAPQGLIPADFLCPGHPLLDAVIDMTLERHRDLLRRGTVLVDDRDLGTQPRMLFFIEHSIQDASLTRTGERRIVSRRLLYVELSADGAMRHIQYAPYLDYRPISASDPAPQDLLARPECAWIDRDLEQKAIGHAIGSVVPEHLTEVRSARLELVSKTEAAVKDRLSKEITHWDHRAEQLRLEEQAGRPNARLNSGEARKRADLLQGRLEKRLQELRLEAQISPLPPVVLGGLLVVPAGLLNLMAGAGAAYAVRPADTRASAARARAAVMDVERRLGFDPTDREFERLGYDVESRIPGTGKLRFIEVKGRVTGADTITVTKNEILYSLNKPDDFILAMVEFLDGTRHQVHYLRRPFEGSGITLDFNGASVDFPFADLIRRAQSPH